MSKTKINFKYLVRVFLLFCAIQMNDCLAEDFAIKISSGELGKLAALEIKLKFDPLQSCEIEEVYQIDGAKTLFTSVDKKHALIRIFLDREIPNSITINGRLQRLNYSGDIKAEIKKITYISKLGQNIKEEDIKHSLEIIKTDETLPFMGIVKGEILGPRERIYQDKLFVAISNIESYGFNFDKSVRKVTINGQKAKFINNEIISSYINMKPLQKSSEELDIYLELEVGTQTIKKKIGTLTILDSVS